MEYVHTIDFEAIEKSGADEHLILKLLDHAAGAENCAVNCIKTPPGGGSPGGLHKHAVDQIFYILSGAMSIEIEDKQYDCGPGALVFFPAGVAHRNWNHTDEPTVHLAFNTPMPDPTVPFVEPV